MILSLLSLFVRTEFRIFSADAMLCVLAACSSERDPFLWSRTHDVAT